MLMPPHYLGVTGIPREQPTVRADERGSGPEAHLQEDRLQMEAKQTTGETSAGLQVGSPPSNAVRDEPAACRPHRGPRMASGRH